MSASVNNGVQVGRVHLLVLLVDRPPSATRTIVGSIIALLTEGEGGSSTEWEVSVRSSESGEILATRRFARRRQAERARSQLVASAEAAADLDLFDWPAHLAVA